MFPRTRPLKGLWLIPSQGAFVAAPIGGLLWGFGAFALRVSFQWVRAKLGGGRFDSFDRPVILPSRSSDAPAAESEEDHGPGTDVEASSVKGKFF